MVDHRIYPASIVSNIKKFIPITLEMNNDQYESWAELFLIHCRAFLVIDHINPPATTVSSSTRTTNDTTNPTPPADWDRLDAIIELKNIFHDNRASRQEYLQHKFNNTRLDDFPNASAYCQELKVLADQLPNVGPKIHDDHLVLQLVTGLNEAYESIASQITHKETLPSFYAARSMLILEETHKANQAANSSSSVLTALASTTTPSVPTKPPSSANNSCQNNSDHGYGQFNRGRNNNRGDYRGRGGYGYRRSCGRGYSGQQNYTNNPNFNSPNFNPSYGPWAW
ncbi:uncharacterized protein [Rutidosis leptorrhynchoides]|uniref:uncharacterized protein n=1 Tax=Rutidosis leptorrhynchoides TaxID=125765 RepID=UPI003A9A62D7